MQFAPSQSTRWSFQGFQHKANYKKGRKCNHLHGSLSKINDLWVFFRQNTVCWELCNSTSWRIYVHFVVRIGVQREKLWSIIPVFEHNALWYSAQLRLWKRTVLKNRTMDHNFSSWIPICAPKVMKILHNVELHACSSTGCAFQKDPHNSLILDNDPWRWLTFPIFL